MFYHARQLVQVLAQSSEAGLPSQSSYQINLKFSCQVVLQEWIQHNGSVSSHQVVLPERVHQTKPLLLRQLSDLEKPRHQNYLMNLIEEWLSISEDDAYRISRRVIQSTLQFTRSALPRDKVFSLEFRLSKAHVHSLLPKTFENGERLLLQRLEAIMAAGGLKMVPATDESIKNLKTKRVEDDTCAGCVICLEELSEGYEAVSMPCSHLFHGDCIQEWLKTSHYCPVCRFEMPTTATWLISFR